MTATIHKVAAGNGYEYYLRNVAANDDSSRGRSSLADYYSAHGEAPGRWHGSGLAALGLHTGDEVTEEQMKFLFGLGLHPNADAIEDRVYDEQIRLGAKHKDAARAAEKAGRLGQPYRLYSDVSEFRKRCARAFTEHNKAHEHHPDDAISESDRARIRTHVAFDMFTEEYGRPPVDARELSGWVAKNSRPNTTAVAGFDITFSPVKSVSVLWAVAPRAVSEKIEAAHHAAVEDALGWLEQHGIFTRLGRNGVRHVDVEGIVAAVFSHRDSRAGDADLHTHVLMANRVRTLDGKWRTLDGATIYASLVTVSEIYNTRLEHHCEHMAGLEFAERPGLDPAKRPIREIVGIPAELISAWSRRDSAINARLGQLAAAFQTRHGREPTAKEIFDLAEAATLQTRPIKHLLRSLAEQRRTWRAEAAQLLGGRDALARMVSAALNPTPIPRATVTEEWITRTAERVIEVVSEHRATWQAANLRAEIERQLRGQVAGEEWERVAEAILAEAISPAHAIRLDDPDLADHPELRTVPTVLQRRDGASVYSSALSQRYTSARTLRVEAQLIEMAVQPGARQLPPEFVVAAVRDYNTAHPDQTLNAGQISVIEGFAASSLRVRTTNAPAGSGKTTAMAVLADAWQRSGGQVLGLAPTAAAAAVLGESIHVRVETVDKVLDVLSNHTPSPDNILVDREFPPPLPQWILDISSETLVIVDEHVKIGNRKRLRLLKFLADRGATIRCLGDSRQLAAIEAGGVDADMDAAAPEPLTLTHVVRFDSTAEATASLQLREGDPTALGWYLDNGRIHAGHQGATHDDAFTAWSVDHLAGRDTIMLAANHAVVSALNARARAERLARSGTETGPCCLLIDDNLASVGDTIRTRRNDPRLRVGARDWVRNGYAWTVAAVHEDESLTAVHLRSGGETGASVWLPADYVSEHVRLGYATTIDSAQGITADTCHVALTGNESLQQLYVALTRGIYANHVYVPTALDGSEGSFWSEPAVYPRTAVEILCRVLGRDGVQKSAHTMLRDALDPYQRLARALDVYLDAIGLAAENALGPDALERLDADADTVVAHLTDCPAYPVLRQHLATIALSGRDPITALRDAANERELATADDVAAVLDWRLDSTGKHSAGSGPLPWATGIPDGLRHDHDGTQLVARAQIVTDLAQQIRTDARTWTPATAPRWARPLIAVAPSLVEELAFWRASLNVDERDMRPTGRPRYSVLEREHQKLLDTRVTAALGDQHNPANRWAPAVEQIEARIVADPWWPIIADKIEVASRAGIDIATRLAEAAPTRPLPDEMPAAALWSRLDLEPSALDTPTGHTLRPDWIPNLHTVLGEPTAEQIIADPAWPRLVAAIDRTLGHDWTPQDLLSTAYELILSAQPEDAPALRPDQLALALAWRIDALRHDHTDPQPTNIADSTMNPHDPTSSTAHPDHTAERSPGGPPMPSPAADAPPAMSDQIAGVAALLGTGDTRAARRAFAAFTRNLTDEQRDIIERVATILHRYPFINAVARLQWAASRYPEHRDLINACTPADDPRTYQPTVLHPTHRPPRDHRDVPAHDHRGHTDPTRTRPLASDAEVVAAHQHQDYLDTYGNVDDDPGHGEDQQQWPIPRGVVHHYYVAKEHRDLLPHQPRYPEGDPDYDRFALRTTRALPCVTCGIERAVNDTLPKPPRRSDDGLCGECRDNNATPIPDHHPNDHIRARCHHLAATHPPDTLRGLLRRDWHAARTLAERLAISSWAETQLPPEPTQPDTSPDPVEQNPLTLLDDTQIQRQIADLELRIPLVDDDNALYGPAPESHDVDTESADMLHRHRTAQEAIRTARAAENALEQAVRDLHALTTEIEEARTRLDAIPGYRRGARRDLQADIEALLAQQADAIRTRETARTTARTAQREATLHAGTADHWDRVLVSPPPERTEHRPVPAPDSNADRQDQIDDYRDQIARLRTEQQRRTDRRPDEQPQQATPQEDTAPDLAESSFPLEPEDGMGL
ncbi:MobF family relaxase [Nocardia brasiliensis]|uniref:MobF family relaxase n=1 Tax=Nocardia brasiliensis TaxID=37326 RepID=UPI0009DC956F|nr:MobF family relaxase [Nocardia brasiliensis]